MRPCEIERLAGIKRALRDKHAWPGGYPIFLVMRDGEAMSIDAARENWREICSAHFGDPNSTWLVEAPQINWEDGELFCAHSGARIESAYAEPEDESTF